MPHDMAELTHVGAFDVGRGQRLRRQPEERLPAGARAVGMGTDEVRGALHHGPRAGFAAHDVVARPKGGAASVLLEQSAFTTDLLSRAVPAQYQDGAILPEHEGNIDPCRREPRLDLCSAAGGVADRDE